MFVIATDRQSRWWKKRQIVCRSRDANAVCQIMLLVHSSLHVYNLKDQDCFNKNITRRIEVWSAFAANKCPRKKQPSVTVLSGRDDLKVQFQLQQAAARDTRDIVARIPAIIYLKYTVWPFVAFLQTQPRQSWIREHRGGYRLLVCCCIHNTTAPHTTTQLPLCPVPSQPRGKYFTQLYF